MVRTGHARRPRRGRCTGVTTAALWTPPVRLPVVELPTPSRGDLRRWVQTLADPRTLTAIVVVGLVLLLGFRQPITRAIGTAGAGPAAQLNARPLVRTPPLVLLPRPVVDPVVVRLHAPRDPFRPLGAPSESGTGPGTGAAT